MQKFSEITYTRPDVEALLQKLEQEIQAFSEATTFDAQRKAMQAVNDIRKEYGTLTNVVMIRHTIDTSNTFYQEEQDFWDANSPKFTALDEKYYRALSASPFKKELQEVFGEQLFVIAELTTKTFVPEILADMQEENRLSSEYTKLRASAKVEFEGKEYNLAGLEPYTNSTDRATRKKASKAASGFFLNNAEKFDEIYDKQVQVRHSMAQKMGYENYVKLAYAKLTRSDYSAKEIAHYRELIRTHVVPLVNKIKNRQKKSLGLDTLYQYDGALYFPDGNPQPKGSPEWILENGVKMYDELSPETKEFFHFMKDNELLDLVNKENKAGGGYCTMMPSLGAPFIFSNFNGTAHDVDVLTHEAGHAFQCYNSRHFEVMEYYWPTMEACEIHSMSMEFFAWPWVELFFKEDTAKYKYYHLAKSLSFLPYGAAVDEFQHLVYENPTYTPAQRNAAWKNIDAKYFPEKQIDDDAFLTSGGAWQRQMHIYQMPFYYIDYTLAQICAFQFWIRMQQDFKGAWADYLKLCKAGGSMSFLKLVEMAGLKSPFEEATFVEVVKHIDASLDNLYKEFEA